MQSTDFVIKCWAMVVSASSLHFTCYLSKEACEKDIPKVRPYVELIKPEHCEGIDFSNLPPGPEFKQPGYSIDGDGNVTQWPTRKMP